MDLKRTFSFVMAVLLATSLIGGAAVMADRHTSLDTSPVEDAEAGVVVVGAVIGAYALGVAACDAGYICDSVNKTELAKADALETKTAIHSQALSQAQNNANYLTNVDNDLNGMETIATMEGKNAYIRALENGSSEAVARSKARQAVGDFYAKRQKMLINQWEITVYSGDSMAYVAQNSSNVSETFARDLQYTVDKGDDSHSGGLESSQYVGANASVTLANGSTVSVASVTAEASVKDTVSREYVTATINPSTGDVSKSVNAWTFTYTGVKVRAPTDNFSPAHYVDFSKWHQRWTAVSQQNTKIQNRLDDFINVTYANYVAGDIDKSDLIDPYLGAREYDPEGNFDSYSIRAAAAMGISPPSNLSHVGQMEVVTGSRTYSGILMSAGNHTFKVGTTYNATTLNGSQYMLDTETGRTFELEGDFTLSEIRTPDGSTKESVNYDKIGYQATDISMYKEKIQMYKDLISEIEARQQRLRDGGTGGPVFPEMPGNPMQQAVAVIGVLLILALLGAAVVSRGRGDRIEIGR